MSTRSGSPVWAPMRASRSLLWARFEFFSGCTATWKSGRSGGGECEAPDESEGTVRHRGNFSHSHAFSRFISLTLSSDGIHVHSSYGPEERWSYPLYGCFYQRWRPFLGTVLSAPRYDPQHGWVRGSQYWSDGHEVDAHDSQHPSIPCRASPHGASTPLQLTPASVPR